MLRPETEQIATMLIASALLGASCSAATAAVHIEGQAQAGGGPLANSTATLWAGSSGDPRQLAQTKTGNSEDNVGTGIVIYLTAQGGAAAVHKGDGDSSAIVLLSVLGDMPPAKAVINEMTTVASVWTNVQFLNGTVLKGHPWAATIDGNDNVWISNSAGAHSPIVELCGVRTDTCPPAFKTGDQIGPPGGYVGGGLKMQTDLAISPAGDVWVMNNWQDIDSCFGVPPDALSTRCGGQGVTIFFGIAKPVSSPQIGPAHVLGER